MAPNFNSSMQNYAEQQKYPQSTLGGVERRTLGHYIEMLQKELASLQEANSQLAFKLQPLMLAKEEAGIKGVPVSVEPESEFCKQLRDNINNLISARDYILWVNRSLDI